MTPRTYYYETTVQLGPDEGQSFEVKASFTVAWGRPATGCFGPVEGFDPGSDHEVEDIKVLTIDGEAAGWGQRFAFGYQTDAQIADLFADALMKGHAWRMLSEAVEDECGRRDDAIENRAAERREQGA